MLRPGTGGKYWFIINLLFLKKLKTNMESVPWVFLLPSKKKLKQIQDSASALQQALSYLAVYKTVLSLTHTEDLHAIRAKYFKH